MKPYLPEWKVYLWKKLLLDRIDPAAVLSVNNFLYFDQAEYRRLSLKHMQKTIDSIPHRMTIRNGVVEADNSMDTPSADYYYNIKPRDVLISLIELAEQTTGCLEITEIFLKKEIIEKYRNERKKYLSEVDKKRMASLTNPLGQGWVSNPDDRFTDPFCGLSQSLYEKIENGEEVCLSDLKEFTSSTDDLTVLSLASFKVNLNMENTSAYVDNYINDFITGDLIPADRVRYFQFQHQKDNIFGSIKQIAVKFGSHNMVITYEEIAKYGGWEYKDERHYRFYETLLALEKLGEIEIKSLRGEEVIISVVDKQTETKTVTEIQDETRERFNKDYNQFGIKRGEILKLSNQIDRYKEKVIEVNKQATLQKESGDAVRSHKDPMTGIENGNGYLLFQGERISLGDPLSGKFKLVEALCHPKFGIQLTIDMVYGSTQPRKDKNKTDALNSREKLGRLSNQIKEVNRAISDHEKQKKPKNFKSRLSLKSDSKLHPKSVWLEQRAGRGGQ